MRKNRIYYKKLDIEKRKYFVYKKLLKGLEVDSFLKPFLENGNTIISMKYNFHKKLCIKARLKNNTVFIMKICKKREYN